MVTMSKQKKPTPEKPDKRKRNVIFVTLDDDTEALLKRFIEKQRVPPDRAAVAYTALVEFLKREATS